MAALCHSCRSRGRPSLWKPQAMTETRPKVAACVPYYRTAEGPTLLSVWEMAAFSARHIDVLPIGSPGSYIEQGRNAAVKMVFETGIDFDYIFWLDTNMIFP